MISAQLRDAKVVVDLAALKHNFRTQLAQLPAGSQILPVVKANAYGNGLVPVVNALKDEPAVSGFCVALLDEGLALRAAGVNQLTLVLGITPVQYAPVAARAGISLTVGDVAWLKAYLQLARASQLTTPLKVHLGIDTGMGRIGFTDPAALQEAVALLADPHFEFEGLFTHFATADSADDQYFKAQVAKWQAMLAVVKEKPRYVHAANSATALWHSDQVAVNYVRMGISLYGCNPSGRELTPTWSLQPVTALEARLTFVKQLKKGASVSYGATYTAPTDEWVGTVPVGYADGYPRSLSGGSVLINGQRCPILGRICMDQFMVRLPQALPVGTKVVLIGKSGDAEITATDLADRLGTINYEVLTGLSDRLAREYRE